MIAFDVNVQKQLIVAVLDDFCANAALPHLHGGQFGTTPDRWRDAVIQFLNWSLTNGLIEVLPTSQASNQKGATGISRLLIEGDIENGLEPDLAWQIIYFQGTEKLRATLGQCHLDSWNAMSAEISQPLRRMLSGESTCVMDIASKGPEVS